MSLLKDILGHLAIREGMAAAAYSSATYEYGTTIDMQKASSAMVAQVQINSLTTNTQATVESSVLNAAPWTTEWEGAVETTVGLKLSTVLRGYKRYVRCGLKEANADAAVAGIVVCAVDQIEPPVMAAP